MRYEWNDSASWIEKQKNETTGYDDDVDDDDVPAHTKQRLTTACGAAISDRKSLQQSRRKSRPTHHKATASFISAGSTHPAPTKVASAQSNSGYSIRL